MRSQSPLFSQPSSAFHRAFDFTADIKPRLPVGSSELNCSQQVHYIDRVEGLNILYNEEKTAGIFYKTSEDRVGQSKRALNEYIIGKFVERILPFIKKNAKCESPTYFLVTEDNRAQGVVTPSLTPASPSFKLESLLEQGNSLDNLEKMLREDNGFGLFIALRYFLQDPDGMKNILHPVNDPFKTLINLDYGLANYPLLVKEKALTPNEVESLVGIELFNASFALNAECILTNLFSDISEDEVERLHAFNFWDDFGMKLNNLIHEGKKEDVEHFIEDFFGTLRNLALYSDQILMLIKDDEMQTQNLSESDHEFSSQIIETMHARVKPLQEALAQFENTAFVKSFLTKLHDARIARLNDKRAKLTPKQDREKKKIDTILTILTTDNAAELSEMIHQAVVPQSVLLSPVASNAILKRSDSPPIASLSVFKLAPISENTTSSSGAALKSLPWRRKP